MQPRSYAAPRVSARALCLVTLTAAVLLPRTAAAESRVVAVVPMGNVDPKTVRVVASAIQSTLQVETRIEPQRPLPKAAWYAPRQRWRAEKLLEAIDAAPPGGAWKVVIVTDAGISTTTGAIGDWGIGGLGNIGGRSCVVSTYLIRKHSRSNAVAHERIRKLAIHELGHTLGLHHCPVFACVMQDAKGKLIRSLDASTDRYCGRCRKRLARDLLTRR